MGGTERVVVCLWGGQVIRNPVGSHALIKDRRWVALSGWWTGDLLPTLPIGLHAGIKDRSWEMIGGWVMHGRWVGLLATQADGLGGLVVNGN